MEVGVCRVGMYVCMYMLSLGRVYEKKREGAVTIEFLPNPAEQSMKRSIKQGKTD